MKDVSETTNYDSIADIYITHTERQDSWNNLYERPCMIFQFPSFKGKNILDVGSGSGFYTEYALHQGAYVTAIDASKLLLNRLSARLNTPSLRTICADIAKPLSPLDSDSFDYIICSLVLHYIKDWEPLLAELHRVMKVGGRIFISTHHPYLVLQYSLLKDNNYFDTVLVEDTWGQEESSFKVHYYTRPLKETLKPIINSQFKIISIDEPLPNERCKILSPRTFQRLTEEPGFLFITLEK
jgi:SAM-dependent methyltransferase